MGQVGGVNVLEAIPHGRASARRKADLARLTGLPTRSVEAEIERLRKSGLAAICSDSQVGYWRPLTAAEYEGNIARRRHRAIGQMLTVRGERLALRRWQGVRQATLWE